MDFIEVKVQCHPEYTDFLIAELGEIEFNSFVENEEGFDAYIESVLFSEPALQEVFSRYAAADIHYSFAEQPKVNWNEEWEKNYDPIDVDGKCYIRATFHAPRPEFPLEIVIVPKMSFGTGHHQTTWQMVKHQMAIDHKGKRVLDVGCGTAILALVAAKLGASYVEGFDIDQWSVENSIENAALNGFNQLVVKQGTIAEVKPQGPFDIILANINRNVLLAEIPVYAELMANHGQLLLSGFYEQDIADIQQKAESCGLSLQNSSTRDKWAALVFQKA